ncbi:PREDICTED: CMP-N-acetylneuraminate-beta-galactosamide-alpha-2,3-sialyltransferase 1-like [Cyprinodon variegatus]|uniref:CMP-N-acetylneuraminate-beta-galactosamide- alpha-2,3-sialyltransferase 1-like n=1 Tax=Cyprinodon variegatus TaxID=28743 RepID=UPI00074271E9|nr:PREDICTED: CMP-N-acetylneuraminate-beta-galactosamide-alpha-2,3-sialyltransferase 1-like [Cyprinodon variegatus]
MYLKGIDSHLRVLLRLKMCIFLLAVTTAGIFLALLKSSELTEWIQNNLQNTCQCVKCFSKEDEFLNRYLNRSIEPFLSANVDLSEEEFKWWSHLQSNSHNFSYFKATIKTLFKIIPPTPVFEKPQTEGCRTCAVVGNSINLKGSHYGPLIDFQDVIIRINYGRVKGYEQDVGARTTHRVMYPESGSTLDNTTHLVLFAFKIRDLEWLIKSLPTGISGNQTGSVGCTGAAYRLGGRCAAYSPIGKAMCKRSTVAAPSTADDRSAALPPEQDEMSVNDDDAVSVAAYGTDFCENLPELGSGASGRGMALPLVRYLRLLGMLTAASAVVPLGLLSLRPLQMWLNSLNLDPTRNTHRLRRLRVGPQCLQSLSQWRRTFYFGNASLGLLHMSRLV